ncbi:MAG: OsmC family peroxiredoxin [Thaumarchaeota archaeon]|nr:OsmC family peroxiredoxin [Nitrososphaerota archaeon]
MPAQRKAEVVWEGDLLKGNGVVKLNSGGLPEFPVTWASRVEQPGGKTSPEELLAAAQASCFAMALSATLARNRTPPQRLHITAVCTLDKVGDANKVTSMQISVAGNVPGIDQQQFDELAKKAENGCPISNAIRGNVEITLSARLE